MRIATLALALAVIASTMIAAFLMFFIGNVAAGIMASSAAFFQACYAREILSK